MNQRRTTRDSHYHAADVSLASRAVRESNLGSFFHLLSARDKPANQLVTSPFFVAFICNAMLHSL